MDTALPLPLVASRVTVTEETYQPLAPAVPAELRVLTGSGWRSPVIQIDWLRTVSEFPATSVAKKSTTRVPFPPIVNGALHAVQGPRSIRYCSDWTPLVASELVRVTVTGEGKDRRSPRGPAPGPESRVRPGQS